MGGFLFNLATDDLEKGPGIHDQGTLVGEENNVDEDMSVEQNPEDESGQEQQGNYATSTPIEPTDRPPPEGYLHPLPHPVDVCVGPWPLRGEPSSSMGHRELQIEQRHELED
jgi:hypothetical protein